MWRTIADIPAGVIGAYEQHFNARDEQFHLKTKPLEF